jgi:hypothetical protein
VDADAIAPVEPEPTPRNTDSELLGSKRCALPPRRPAVTPSRLDFTPLVPDRSGAIRFVDSVSESGSSELSVGARAWAGWCLAGPAVPLAPPQPARLELGWPALDREREGWVEGEIGLLGTHEPLTALQGAESLR